MKKLLSDDGRLRPPAGAITDACGRGDAPGLVWIAELPDFDPLASELATHLAEDGGDKGVSWGSVGRPGLDPGTLGLKEGALSSTQCGRAHRPWWSQLGIPAVTSEWILVQAFQ